ncbi:hypothetical protein, partial [Streptomyces sp. NPDC001274]
STGGSDNGGGTDDGASSGALALAPREGLGVRDEEMRAKHLDAINLFRDAPTARTGEHGRGV